MLNTAEKRGSPLSRAVDVDSHEMAPAHLWREMFGEHTARLAEVGKARLEKLSAENRVFRPGIQDNADITQASVWETKGIAAPGAFDFERRLQVLDEMGTARQLVFASAAILGFAGLYDAGLGSSGLDDRAETKAMLRGVCDEYNAWALRTTAAYKARFRPAAMVVATSVEELLATGEELIDGGARALWLPTSAPPAGCSPADPALQPFWTMCEDANVAVVLHLGSENGFRASSQWSKAPAFKAEKQDSLEIELEPFSATTMRMPAEAYLTAMIMGGVFERHSRLRFGVLELGATWLGPLADHLDVWAGMPFRKRMASVISMKPSEYIARNVRVTPFYFEPVDTYFQRWPNLHDCYCYSTDYPHFEGGPHVKERFYKLVEPFGEEAVEKFFATNGAWLVPD